MHGWKGRAPHSAGAVSKSRTGRHAKKQIEKIKKCGRMG
jgi:hypothetical protein